MAATAVVSRENIESWGEDSLKLSLLRHAVAAMQDVSDQALMDERGYQWVAGVHGGFGGQPFCEHGTAHFVTWHRAYLLDMELKLRAQIATLAGEATANEWRLPYWDWAAPGAGLPAAFTAETYQDAGTTRPNPLFSAPYQLPDPIGGLDPQDATWRGPETPGMFDDLGPRVDDAIAETTFPFFTTALEGPHNSVHVRVGGFMATFRSSFDPLFWVHHANIDRQFWMWQQRNGGIGTIPAAVRDFECQPFDFADIRAAAFLDTRELGYTYAIVRSPVLDRADLPGADEQTVLGLDFGPVPQRFDRARINLHNVRHPERNVVLRFFADRAAAPDADTATSAAEGFLASRVVLGHGPCPGAPGHCDPEPEPITGARLRRPHHLAPFDLSIPVTRPLAALPADAGRRTAFMIVVSPDGEQLPLSALQFDNATVTVG